VIRRDNTHITIVKDDNILKQSSAINEGAIFGIVGILNIEGVNYLGVISEIAKVGQINKANINKVVSVKLLPFKVSLAIVIDLSSSG
jgi:hypothetical protein